MIHCLRQHTHFYINNWGVRFDNSAFLFSVMAGLIVEMLYMLSLFMTLRNGLKMSEYEAYWLTHFPLIIYWVRAKK